MNRFNIVAVCGFALIVVGCGEPASPPPANVAPTDVAQPAQPGAKPAKTGEVSSPKVAD